MPSIPTDRPRPRSPNIQIYRPQLTSVLSIANRMTGIALGAFAVAMVVWLISIAAGPTTYATVQSFIGSWLGQILLLGCTFSFFLHLCGGIRHLVWDAGHGFSLGAIYASGWTVVAASVMLTALTWGVGITLAGHGR